MKKEDAKTPLQKIWYFLWEEDSVLSWIANIIIAFLVVRFLIYPLLSLIFGTPLPIVAVVSGSMEHSLSEVCLNEQASGCLQVTYTICSQVIPQKQSLSFDDYWKYCGPWYEKNANISKEKFADFPQHNGFNTGDVMIIYRKSFENIKVGDVIVFHSRDNQPIIHRIVKINNTTKSFVTKGDHNGDSSSSAAINELNVTYEQYQGNAVFKIPFVGYLRIFAGKIVSFFQ